MRDRTAAPPAPTGPLAEIWTDPEEDYDYGATAVTTGKRRAPWKQRARDGAAATGWHLLRWLLCLTCAGFSVEVFAQLGLTTRAGGIGGGALAAGSFAVFLWQARQGAPAVAQPVRSRGRKGRRRG